jgi:hypothetical protein
VIDPRTVPVRFSRLKNMAKSPAHYLASVQDDGDDTLSRRLGRGAHAITFGQPVAVYDGIRRGSAWADFQAEHHGAEILNVAEAEKARGIAGALLSDPVASRLLSMPGASVEKRIDWTYLDRACQSTPDLLHSTEGVLVDLKTCRTAEPERFMRAAEWYSYHAQLAFYQDSAEAAGHVRPDQCFIVAVESAPPYAVTVLRLTERALEAGRKLCRLWFERLLQCEAANEWPAYAQSVQDWDIPEHEQDGEFRLVIDGDEVEVA